MSCQGWCRLTEEREHDSFDVEMGRGMIFGERGHDMISEESGDGKTFWVSCAGKLGEGMGALRLALLRFH